MPLRPSARIEQETRITVGELKRRLNLEGCKDDTEITFGCTRDAVLMKFYRLKWRDENLIQIELEELHDDELED